MTIDVFIFSVAVDKATLKKSSAGWLKDKYGVSWQIVLSVLGEMMQDESDKKLEGVMQALLKMKKIDIERLKRAYEGDNNES